jgi:hypothetical protein
VRHDCVGADDDVITDGNAAKYFCACAHLHPITYRRRSERIVITRVAECHAVADQAVVAYDRGPMDHDATVVLDSNPPTDARARTDRDAAHDFDHFVEYDVDNGPRSSKNLVLDPESGVPESIDKERPKSQAEQPFTLCLEVFQYYIHDQIVGSYRRSGHLRATLETMHEIRRKGQGAAPPL